MEPCEQKLWEFWRRTFGNGEKGRRQIIMLLKNYTRSLPLCNDGEKWVGLERKVSIIWCWIRVWWLQKEEVWKVSTNTDFQSWWDLSLIKWWTKMDQFPRGISREERHERRSPSRKDILLLLLGVLSGDGFQLSLHLGFALAIEAHLLQKAAYIWWLIEVGIKDLSFSAHYKITVTGHFNSTAPFKDCWTHLAFILSCSWLPSSPNPIQQSSVPFQRCWLLSTKYLLESSSQRIQASQRIHQKYGA